MNIWKFEVYRNDTLCCKVVARGDKEETARQQAENYTEQHKNHSMKSCGLASSNEAKYLSDEDSATQIMYSNGSC